MDVALDNVTRVANWLDAIVAAMAADDLEELRGEYHQLFHRDAELFIPGDTKLSGTHIGFDGWKRMTTIGREVASQKLTMNHEQILANESIAVAVLEYVWHNGEHGGTTRATELRWFGSEGLIFRGEFMASDWSTFSRVFAKN